MSRHLLIVYSSEVLVYERSIYLNRCKAVLKTLDEFNHKWHKNEYFTKMSFLKKIYVYFFKHNMFFVCKLIVLFLRKVGKL